MVSLRDNQQLRYRLDGHYFSNNLKNTIMKTINGYNIAQRLTRKNLQDRLRVERGRGYGSTVVTYRSQKGKIEITKQIDDVHILDYWGEIIKWLNYDLEQKPTDGIAYIINSLDR